MKNQIIILFILLLSNFAFGQKLISGDYDMGLMLAYDNKLNKLTGYFQNYTGWDEKSKSARFSCVFYIEGTLSETRNKLKTYYPLDDLEGTIFGTLDLINNKTIKIKLTEEHGGCWNVFHFASEPAKFELQKSIDCIQIRFVNSDKTYFHTEKSNDKMQKSYLVKKDFVCVSKIENDWAYCTYYGMRTTKGWIKIKDLNKL